VSTTDVVPLLDLSAVCHRLGVSERTGHRYIRERGLPAYQVGGMWKVDADDLEAWVRTRPRPVEEAEANA
jgi:excisionase family DNA binding protein